MKIINFLLKLNFRFSDDSKLPTPDLSQNAQYGFDGVHHTYTDPRDNTVYIWDKDKNAWFPKVDDDFLAHYQMNYGFVDNTKDEKIKEEIKEAEKKEKEAAKRKPTPQEPSKQVLIRINFSIKY